MEITFSNRLKKAWNAFTNRDPTIEFQSTGIGYSYRQDKMTYTKTNERSIITSIFNRIALDVASITFKHCRLDKNGRYLEDINSELNNCLTLEANMDQTARAFIQDLVYSMLSEGSIAAVPVDTDVNPNDTNSFDVISMRVGQILEWKPAHVKLKVYNERKGEKEDIVVPKRTVAIMENPLYAVINSPNATAQRLMRKLSLLDVTDEKTASGKLDLIIQLPYAVKTEVRRQQADIRVKDIENQLSTNKYGIAYIDGTEKITQLNRSVENNLMKQVEFLTNQLFAELGMTQSILNGTASEQEMLNYYNRSIEPIASVIVDSFKRTFLTRTARTQNQSIVAFRDPFKLVPINNIAEIADKFTRNCIMTSNEIRQIIGMKPSDDPKADQLINSNISQPAAEEGTNKTYAPSSVSTEGNEGEDTTNSISIDSSGSNGSMSAQDQIVNDLLDSLESEIDKIIGNYV